RGGLGGDGRRPHLRGPQHEPGDAGGAAGRAVGGADPHRVHPAGDVHGAPAPGAHPRADPEGGVGLRLRAVVELARRLRHVPAPQDRGGRRTAPGAHGAGRGLRAAAGRRGVSGLLRRFRTLPMRARLSLLVAAAVASAVAAVSVTCWFIVQGKLYEQLDKDLEKATVLQGPQREGEIRSALNTCTATPRDTVDGSFQDTYSQVVRSDGTVCLFPSSAGRIDVTRSDREVIASAGSASSGVHRDGTDQNGDPVRVLTLPLVINNPTTLTSSKAAVLVAVPLKGTESTLDDLALILLLVSGVGVVGASAAGLAVARAGLRPVDRLTEAVEHVARTEDLGVRIPVDEESDGEIARLSRSFNAMTSALASSRDLQQQLIADAGHELRTPLTSLRTNIELLTRSEETGRPIPPADRAALLASVKAQM